MKGNYVDGFVFPIAKNKVAAYKKMAAWGAKYWMKAGALGYYECQGDDLKVKAGPDGSRPRSFRDTAKAKANETVWFSFIIYRDKKHRDEVNKKVNAQMNKEAEKWKDFEMPFDPRKMSYGGFKVIVVK